jgi:hypothetical protein
LAEEDPYTLYQNLGHGFRLPGCRKRRERNLDDDDAISQQFDICNFLVVGIKHLMFMVFKIQVHTEAQVDLID